MKRAIRRDELRAMPADEPLRTICAQTKDGHHALVTAFLAKHFTGVVGAPMAEPLHTVTALVRANVPELMTMREEA